GGFAARLASGTETQKRRGLALTPVVPFRLMFPSPQPLFPYGYFRSLGEGETPRPEWVNNNALFIAFLQCAYLT
ncbi:MAG: hypothetical protein ABI700_34420, partial [Chloroflexota bacterium]